jgi:hypothetical protein
MIPSRCLVLLALVFGQMSIAAPVGLPALAVPDALGVNIHFTDPRPGEMRMLADGGFKICRMDFTWGGTERKPGEYDFGAYDRLLQSLEPHGIRALFILDYGNRHYDEGKPPHTDEGRRAMAKWAAAAVNHFKGKGVIWEMWNEPNIAQFWKPRPSAGDYAKLAIEVGKAIKSAAPDELYIGPASSTIDLPFLETCFKAGCLQYWDAVSVHPYRQKAPETVTEEYAKLRALIRQHGPAGKAIPILSGEWGFSAEWRNFDADRQGKYLPREFLVNLYNEIPVSIWYDWHDDGPDSKEAEHHFGTVTFPYREGQTPVYEPKPAYLAAGTLAAQLGGYSYNKRLAQQRADDYVLLFSKIGGQPTDVRLAVWTAAKEAHEITLPAMPGAFTITNHTGDKSSTKEATKSGLVITLTDAPQYLVPQKPDAMLRAAALWARVAPETCVKAPGLAELPGAAVPVERGYEPQRARTQLTLGDAAYEQETVVAPANPIHVEPLPVVGDALVFEAQNRTGEPFTGEVRLQRVLGLEPVQWIDQPIQLESGQTAAEVRYAIQRKAPSYQVQFEVWRNRRGDRVHAVVQPTLTRTFRPINVSNPGDLKLTPDGDKAVRSEQSLTAGAAPSPLPGGDLPATLKLDYSFDDGWKFLRVQPAAKVIEGKPRHVAIWVHADNSGQVLKLRFSDAAGQTFQPEGRKIDFKGWRLLAIPMDGTHTTHWGPKDKPGDGEVHYPIQWDTLILIDNPGRQKTAGQLHFAGPTLVE